MHYKSFGLMVELCEGGCIALANYMMMENRVKELQSIKFFPTDIKGKDWNLSS